MGDNLSQNNDLIKRIFLIISFIYLFSSLIQFNFDKNLKITSIQLDLPRVLTGDEPHYLVAINSVIHDLDLEVRNNYDSVLYNNSLQGGINHAGILIGRRENYVLNKTIVNYMVLNKNDVHEFKTEFKYLENNSNMRYISTIPPGLPIFLGGILLSLKYKQHLIEPSIIFITIICSLIGLFYLYKSLVYFSQNEKISLFFTFIFALATPFGVYSKTLYTEPYAASILIISFYLIVVKKQTFLSGLLLGFLFTIKYPFLLFAIPFWFYLLFEDKNSFKKITKFSLSFSIFLFLQFIYNYYFFNNIFITGRSYPAINIFEGLSGILLSPQHGILFFTPFLIFSLVGIKYLMLHSKKEFLLCLGLFLPFYILISGADWGGGSYANRYMIPLLFIFIIPLQFWYKNNNSVFLKRLFYLLLFISLLINIQALLFPALFIDKPPWELINLIIFKINRIMNLLYFY